MQFIAHFLGQFLGKFHDKFLGQFFGKLLDQFLDFFAKILHERGCSQLPEMSVAHDWTIASSERTGMQDSLKGGSTVEGGAEDRYVYSK